ncbi:MAG TPA: rRNA maturation RNase YbeY [Blastocatellia bacterium]|nr:rRNA maturation RNase YbeY [Blastocatellia bacterium]
MAIEVVNRQRLCAIDGGQIARVADAALAAIGRRAASLTVAFVRDRAIRRLNRMYRGKDRATDVLSFPAGDGQEDDFVHASPDDADHLGDIIISTDAARRQAGEAGHPLEREIGELVLHGTLHLCGYDHETDNGEMNRLELRLRRKILGATG